jgi:uncharacterized protein YndB with AHSA1/START domain
MEKKTTIRAEEGKQELWINREFNLPLTLLFKAYEEAAIIEQWMGTKVLMLENRDQGAWRFETTDPKGNKHGFYGVIHCFQREERIIRTFEMDNATIGVQLEILNFEAISSKRSRLNMQLIFPSVEARDELLKLPFSEGINWAHHRLEALLQNH